MQENKEEIINNNMRNWICIYLIEKYFKATLNVLIKLINIYINIQPY